MYNAKSIQSFIDKVNKEAEEAMQSVYDKYSDEMSRRLKAQLHKDDVMWNANGACLVERNGVTVQCGFSDVVAQLQYPVSFNLEGLLPDYKTTKD